MCDRYNPLHLIYPSDPFSQVNKQDELFILLGNKKNWRQTNKTSPTRQTHQTKIMSDFMDLHPNVLVFGEQCFSEE